MSVPSEIVETIDARIRLFLREEQPRVAYGVVESVDLGAKEADVFLEGDSVESDGFAFTDAQVPTVGALVRVFIDPKGDRYIDRVLDPTPAVAAHAHTPSMLRAERAANQSIPNATITTVIWNSIVREDDEAGAVTLNTSTGVITINVAGWYYVATGSRWSGNSTGIRSLFIQQNGTTIARSTVLPSTQQWYLSVSTLLYAAAGATIEIGVEQNSGGALDLIASNHTHVGVAQVRA